MKKDICDKCGCEIDFEDSISTPEGNTYCGEDCETSDTLENN